MESSISYGHIDAVLRQIASHHELMLHLALCALHSAPFMLDRNPTNNGLGDVHASEDGPEHSMLAQA